MKNIELVPLSLRHIMNVMTWVNDPAVNFYFANMGKKSVAEEKKFMQEIIRSKNDKAFSIFDGKEYIAQVSINKIDWLAETGRLFLVIVPSKQHRGYSKLIVNAILREAFIKLKLNKIWLITRLENSGRIQLWEHYGFKQEGILREEYKDSRGKRYDMVRMAMLKRNWKK